LCSKKVSISLFILAITFSTIILAVFLSKDFKVVVLYSKEEGLLEIIQNSASLGLIKEEEADLLFLLISKAMVVISSDHPLSDDLANILDRFEKMGRKEGFDETDLLVLRQTIQVNLAYINTSDKDPELFERFFYPNLNFPFVYIEGQGFNFHPINALNYATELLEYKRDRSSFLKVMRDLLQYIEKKSFKNLDYGVMKFYFAWERESIPWISSISQGIGSAYFAIAYSMTGDEEFRVAAQLLANSFQVPSGMGGFRIDLDYGPFYVEYSNAPFDLVLNGFMLSLKGLWMYSQVIEDSSALEAFSSGIKTLELLLPKYDVEGWSAYSIFYSWSVESYPIFHGMASERYHRLHIRLLYFLGKVSKSSVLTEFSLRWDEYLKKSGSESEIERARQEYEFWISILYDS